MIKKLRKKEKSVDASKPRQGYAYAVSTGKYLGEFFVFIETNKKSDFLFLSLPKMVKRAVPARKFGFGISNKVLEFQEILPKAITEVCIAQFNNIK